MLKGTQPTHGIGVRIARNTLRPYIRDRLADLVLTSVTNANQKKTKANAQHRPKR
jgi:hypothetical protein